MAVAFSKTSPYSGTKTWGIFLDVWAGKTLTQHPTDVTYVIDKIYEHRPDLLAYDLYKDTNLWWVFAVRNPDVINDPIFDFAAGKTIRIPPISSLTSDLGL